MRILRLLLGALSVVFFPFRSNAQTVFIPDTALRTVLNEWVPGCVDAGGFLDPQLPTVMAEDELTLRVRWSPADLTGLEALSQLNKLTVMSECLNQGGYWSVCEEHEINISALPPALVELSLGWGVYGPLPSWPNSLVSLAVTEMHGVTALPLLPSSLSSLIAWSAYDLVALPDLPSSLNTLQVQSCYDLSGLPSLPNGLVELSYSGHMGGLSALPPTLVDLHLYAVTGGSLPPLPSTLQTLSFAGFDDESLDAPWPPGLVELVIYNMEGLTTLPATYPTGLSEMRLSMLPLLEVIPEPLPNELEVLKLTGLPLHGVEELPGSLTVLTLQGMPNVRCLPLLPAGLEELYVDYYELIMQSPTGLTCLPNLPPAMQLFPAWNSNLMAGPQSLCTILNSTCEFVNPAANGAVYWDQNANGMREAGEPGYPLATIHAQPGAFLYGIGATGDFSLPMPFGQYTLNATSDNPYVQSISPATHDADFANASDVDYGNDFGAVLQADVRDLRVDLFGPWGRSGFETSGFITYQNVGTTVADGSVQFVLDADQSWVSSYPAPDAVNGNIISWVFDQLQVGEARTIQLNVYTDGTVPVDTPLEHMVSILPLDLDMTPADNIATWADVVFGSYDPNDKRVEPATLTPAEVMAGKELVYTIRFQNTGNYQADRVVITDTLSSDLQWGTMRFINSSHACGWMLTGDGVLRFTFDPIALPDSTTDEPHSHGFVRFAMKPVSDLMLGESVSNTANIYFDLNEPVITNEAVFSVDASTSVQQASNGTVRIWPNPVESVLYINGAAGKTLEILDVTGRVVLRERSAGAFHGLDVSSLACGGYTLRVMGSGSRTFIKR